MIRINLLPVRQIKQRIKARNEIALLAGMLVFVLLIIGFVGYQQVNKVTGLKKAIVKLEEEKKKYEAVNKKIKKIKKEQALLETKLGVIKDLKANSQLSVRVLDEIARLTPPSRMWLKSFSLDQSSISLNGIALDNATIADYMKKLSGSPFFASAELKNSKQTMVANQKLKAYTLLVKINKPSSKKSSKAKGKKGKKKKA